MTTIGYENMNEIDKVLNLGKSINSGWSKAQLEILGIDWPPVTGWKLRLNNLTDKQVETFMELKNKHIKTNDR